MKIVNKIFASVLSAAILIQGFVPCVMAEDTAAVDYVFSTHEQGVADGTITIGGIPSDALKVRLYWGSDEAAALSDYSDIKVYTSAETVAYNEEALTLTDGAISYTIEGNRYIPEDAKYIIAEITNADNTVTTVSQALTNTGFSDDDMLYSMFWISDVHIRWISYKETSNQSKAFKIMRQVAETDGDKFKGVIMNGDLTDNAYDIQFGLLSEMIDNTFADDYPVYYNIGNHDQFRLTDAKAAFDDYFDKMEGMGYTFDKTNKWSYDTYINGQHYIFWATPNDYGGTYKNWAAGESDYEWLEAKLSEGDRAGAKNYLFTHLLAKDTTPGSGGSSAFNKTDGDTEFAAIMERHPHTVVVTSHVHLDMDTDMKTLISNKNTPSYLDTSSLYYTNTYIPSYTSDINHAYGRYAQIYADKIVVRTMNFQKNQWVPRAEYIIPVDNSVIFEGEVSVSNNGEGLAAGNVLTAKLNGNDIDTSKYSCEWFVSSVGSVGTGTTYTIETADKNVSLKITDNETEAYAYATTGVYSYTEPTDDDTETELTPPEMNNDNTVVENNGVINVTGNAGAENAGKTIMLVIVPKASYNDVSTIKYINETTVGDDGGYTFKFKSDIVSSDDFLMAKLEGQDITNSIISIKASDVMDVDMTMTLTDNVPALEITNKYADAMEDVKLIIATYDASNRLLTAKLTEWNMAFGAYGEAQEYKASQAAEGIKVKVFLIGDFEAMKPLAQSVSGDIVTVETE